MKKFPISLALIFLTVLISSFVVGYWISEISNWLYPSNVDRKGEVVKLLLSIFGGVFVVYGLYISHLRTKAFQTSVEKQDKTIQNQVLQTQLTLRSQINDQFKNAVEHLGDEKTPVILGGIAELHQLVLEDPDKFKNIVAEIFTSYSRSEFSRSKKDKKNSTILQTIINHLFNGKTYVGIPLDLSYCDFLGLRLNNLTIENVNFHKTIMPIRYENTTFTKCNLSYSIHYAGTMTGVTIQNCECSNMYFRSHTVINSKFHTDDDFLQIISLGSNFNDSTFASLNGSQFVETNFFDNILIGEYFIDNIFFACKIGKWELNPSSNFTNSKFFACGFKPFPQVTFVKTMFSGFFDNKCFDAPFINFYESSSPIAFEEAKKSIFAYPGLGNEILPYSTDEIEEIKELKGKLEKVLVLNA